MNEKEQLTFLNTQMSHCIGAIKRIESVIHGDEFNPKGMVHIQEEMKQEIEEIKQYQQKQKGGLNFGKWIIGTGLGAFLLLQFEQIQNFVKHIFNK